MTPASQRLTELAGLRATSFPQNFYNNLHDHIAMQTKLLLSLRNHLVNEQPLVLVKLLFNPHPATGLCVLHEMPPIFKHKKKEPEPSGDARLWLYGSGSRQHDYRFCSRQAASKALGESPDALWHIACTTDIAIHFRHVQEAFLMSCI
jgi:hypothetical protein